MLKKLKRWGAGLGVYFDKEEVSNYQMVEGDTIIIDDMLLFNTQSKKTKKLTKRRRKDGRKD